MKKSAGYSIILAVVAGIAGADTHPPDWNGGSDPPVHFPPVAWPADDGDGLLDYGDWIPYTVLSSPIEDNSTQDPSNGGTVPTSYTNVSSGCTDLTLPSVFLYYDAANQVLMFRWRVQEIANSYATGPTVEPASPFDPWKAELWTVLIDTNGDGYRDYAVQLDGSSGVTGGAVDLIRVYYSDSPDQSLDTADPGRSDICQLAHNPTAFTDDFSPAPGPTGNILNFGNSVTPTWLWSNGFSETVWDYGTTRARLLDGASCTQYFIDVQIPLTALDASATGDPACSGAAVSEDTPIALLFTTSSSLDNPLRHDVVMEPPSSPGDTCALGPDAPASFGDLLTLGGFDAAAGDLGAVAQPIVREVSAEGCNPTTLTASLVDTIDGSACYTGGSVASTVTSVQFYFYYDEDGNGTDDDGNAWTAGPMASPVAGTLDQWQATGWDTTGLRQGRHLVGVRAEDDQGNVTWSHLNQSEVDLLFPGDAANPSPSPGELFTSFLNLCGTTPTVTKSASPDEVTVGGTVDFTITVTAATDQALSLDQIDDLLPAGWVFDSLQGGTLTPDAAAPTETPTASGTTLTWTFTATTLAAGTSGTLVFRAVAPAVSGSYQNQARVVSSNEGTLVSEMVEVGVGAPALVLTKTPDVFSASPGSTVTYTIVYGNDSPVTVTGAVLTDVLPVGLGFSSASGGGVYDPDTRTVSWQLGTLPSGATGASVTVMTNLDSPYPSSAASPLVNTATLDSDDTIPIEADAPVAVSLPLRVQKTASARTVAAGGSVTFTISYENTGTSTGVNAVLTDLIPDGFAFVSATAGGSYNAGTGTVSWSLGNLPGAPGSGSSGSVQVTLQASSPYAGVNPASNTASFDSDNFSAVSDTCDLGVTGLVCTPLTTYLHDSTTDVGGDGSQPVADATAPTGAASVLGPFLVGGNTGGANPPAVTEAEIARFYSAETMTSGVTFSADVTASIYIDISGAPQADITLSLYDYDPATTTPSPLLTSTATPPPTLLATQTVQSGVVTNAQLSFTLATSGLSVSAEHRLLWVLSAANSNATIENTVFLRYDGVASPSSTEVCLLPTARGTINTTVDKLSVTSTPAPLQTLTYTTEFANIGVSTLTGAVLVDELPAGLTYDATFTPLLNGAPVAAPSISGRTLSFASVYGAGDAAGTVSAGNTGTLVFRVSVDNPPSATAATLLNTATLQSNEAPDVVDTAATTLLRPNLTITKSASPTLLTPGDTTTFTVTLTNTGTGVGTNLTVTDTLPVQSYFGYVVCAVDASAAPSATTSGCGFASPTLTASADSLAVGETLVVTIDMQATTAPEPPAGFTTETNTFAEASVTGEPAVQSGSASVTISTAPNLGVDLTADATNVGSNQVVTFTIVVSNTGSADALDVVVSNPIPGLTSVVSGSLTYEGVSRTDADDGDNAAYDPVLDRLDWDLGTLEAGGTRTMTFQLVTDATLPSGSTTIDATATTESSSTASKQDTWTLTASAAPQLSIAKSAPSSLVMPLTTLVGNHTSTTTVTVADATHISLNDYIHIEGSTATQVLAIVGNTLTVSVAITGNNGTPVDPVIPYTILYKNTGDADAAGVVISDPLPDPAGSATSVFVIADSGGTHDGSSPGDVTWNLGTVAAGHGGTVKLWVWPTGRGRYVNMATLSSDDTSDISDDATTDVGVLELSKASLPAGPLNVDSDTTDPKTVVTYTLTVTNKSGAAATGVEVVDTPEPGFLFCDDTAGDATCTSPTLIPAPTTASSAPTDGQEPPFTWCCWDLAAGGTISITFDAKLGFDIGVGNHQNDVSATAGNNIGVLDFDPLATETEDVFVFSAVPVELYRFTVE